MDSGIYKLNFSGGHYYIGKSENIPKRWETHRRNFLQGKHTKRMQWAYDHYGMPDFTKLMTVHEDHIDLYEDAMIQLWWDDNLILNGTRPKQIPQKIIDILSTAERTHLDGTPIMHLSTLEHVELLWQLKQRGDNFKRELADLLDEDWCAQKIMHLEEHNEKLQTQINNFKQLSWWQRIFY